MKYDKRSFDTAVKEYNKDLAPLVNSGKKSFFFAFDLMNRRAYRSLAPLSRAVHNLGASMNVQMFEGKSGILEVLNDSWNTYEALGKGAKSKKTFALKHFLDVAEKKTKGSLSKAFEKPVIFEADAKGFRSGKLNLKYHDKWFRQYRHADLVKTCSVVLEQAYNIRRGELFSIGFDLVLAKKDQDQPLEDYLDNFAICGAMLESAKKHGCRVVMGSSTSRMSMLEPMEPVSDLRATLLGCELSKGMKETVFRKFRAVSRMLRVSRIKINDAAFFIAGKGYGGKHAFGEMIGYPSPSGKTRWQSPGGIIYKLAYYPQTKHDSRAPRARYGFTETLPIDVFIRTSNIDWFAMKKKDTRIRRKVEKCEKLFVRSGAGGKRSTNLEVGLMRGNGKRILVFDADLEIRSKLNKEYYKRTGIKAGCMANIPGGETFMTPEYLKGTFVGDVVINIDRSYVLDKKNPVVVKCDKKGYKIISGPSKVLKAFAKKKKEAWKKILLQEKARSVPQSITDMEKENFNRIGEFAINTNPKAELCDYLIVNEKIAGMIHIALGSGFEEHRATKYHSDIVIDAKGQKLDIWGVDKKGKEYWLLKKGKFVA